MSRKYLDQSGRVRTEPRKAMKGAATVGQAYFIPEDMMPYPYTKEEQTEEVETLDAGYAIPLIKKEDLQKVLEEQKKTSEGEEIKEEEKVETQMFDSKEDIVEIETEEGVFYVTRSEFKEMFGKDVEEISDEDEMFLDKPEEIDLTKL